MAYEQILYEVKDQILTLTLNRPDRLNAFTPRMRRKVSPHFWKKGRQRLQISQAALCRNFIRGGSNDLSNSHKWA